MRSTSCPGPSATGSTNLAIVVEDAASGRDYPQGTLRGAYRGGPLNVRGSGYGMTLPDRIVVFQRPLERMARDEAHLYELVRHTVQHEIDGDSGDQSWWTGD